MSSVRSRTRWHNLSQQRFRANPLQPVSIGGIRTQQIAGKSECIHTEAPHALTTPSNQRQPSSTKQEVVGLAWLFRIGG